MRRDYSIKPIIQKTRWTATTMLVNMPRTKATGEA